MRLACPVAAASLLLVTACTEPNPAYSGPGSGLDTGQVGRDGQQPGADLWWPQTDGGQACAPGSFAGCATAYVLLRCSSTGSGTITVNCAPFLCNATARRCNQCDPKRPPACVGNSVQSCSKDGLLVLTSCPDGCDQGTCKQPCAKQSYWLDADGDGFGDPQQKTEACEKPPGHVDNDQDCNDGDKAAYPGQGSWFYYPMKGYSASDSGAFDYNCDGSTDKYRPGKHSGCTFKNNQCEGSGWYNSVPECGQWGWWVECKKTGMGRDPCMTDFPQKVQSCH